MSHQVRSVGASSSALVRGVACAALLAFVGTAAALPPNPQLNMWRGPLNNCYNYGVNQKDNDFKQPGLDHYGLPDAPTTQQVADAVLAGAKFDGLRNIAWTPGDPIPTPPDGYNLVALGAEGGADWDYHWWRLNGDGTWSHKRGKNDAKTTYTDGLGREQTLTDPREAGQRDGYDLVGFMATPKIGIPTLWDGLHPTPGSERVYALVHSGRDDFSEDFFNISELLTRLPTGSPIADPQWADGPYGTLMGYGLLASDEALAMGMPEYMRVYQGVIELYNSDGVHFYVDNNGLALAVPGPGAGLLAVLGAGAAARRRRSA
jgi:hypothetical protein